MEARYQRNIGAITEKEQEALNNATVLIAGCGGLGGYIIELLARAGVGHLVLYDGDVFEESNLNRQLYATGDTLGQPKASAAKARILAVNPNTRITAVDERLTEENIHGALKGCTLAVDALDNVATRLLLEDACEALNIPYVFGGVNGWFGSVCAVAPGTRVVRRLYGGQQAEQTSKSALGPAVAATAALEAATAIRLLLGEPPDGRMLLMDCKKGTFDAISLFEGEKDG